MKDIDLFCKDKSKKDLHASVCKSCNVLKSKEWRLSNPDRAAELKKEWVKKTDQNSKRRSKYRRNKNHFLQQKKRDYLKHKTKRLEAAKKYYIENKKSVLKKKHLYIINRYRKDINFKLRMLCRNRIFYALKGVKSKQTEELIGCSFDFLKQYLELKFQVGMSWDNYGTWHIDHIKPLNSFDLKKENELKKACNYKNLQPLWATDNLRKGAKDV